MVGKNRKASFEESTDEENPIILNFSARNRSRREKQKDKSEEWQLLIPLKSFNRTTPCRVSLKKNTGIKKAKKRSRKKKERANLRILRWSIARYRYTLPISDKFREIPLDKTGRKKQKFINGLLMKSKSRREGDSERVKEKERVRERKGQTGKRLERERNHFLLKIY